MAHGNVVEVGQIANALGFQQSAGLLRIGLNDEKFR
jgi:hypothetical protein